MPEKHLWLIDPPPAIHSSACWCGDLGRPYKGREWMASESIYEWRDAPPVPPPDDRVEWPPDAVLRSVDRIPMVERRAYGPYAGRALYLDTEYTWELVQEDAKHQVLVARRKKVSE